MAGTITILEFTQATAVNNDDLLWLTQGSGAGRDKKLEASLLKSFASADYVLGDSTQTIDLSNYFGNVGVVITGATSSPILTLSNELPAGSRIVISNNDSGYDATVVVGAVPYTVKRGCYIEFISTGSSMLKVAHVLDEDDMASDSDTAIPTQQSVKAYVDTWKIKTVTSSIYSITDSDMTTYNEIEFDTSSNSITATLPDRATNNGQRIKLTHAIQGSSNTLTINRAGSDTITQDALTSIELPKPGNYIELFASSTTTKWNLLDEKITCTLRLDGNAGYGSVDTLITRFTNERENIGNMFSENHSTGYNGNTEGLEITVNRSGNYACSYTQQTCSGGNRIGFSLNSTQLTTAIQNITKSDVLCIQAQSEASIEDHSGITKYFNAGDVIRPHVASSNAIPTAANTFLTIEYLG